MLCSLGYRNFCITSIDGPDEIGGDDSWFIHYAEVISELFRPSNHWIRTNMDFTIEGTGGQRSKDGLVVMLTTISHAEEVVPRYESIDKSLKLVVKDKEGREFDMFIDGSFARDPQTKAVSGIGSAFKITDVFNRCGIRGELSSEEKIPTAMLAQLVGKQIWRLRYPTERREGKVRYRTWQIVESGSNKEGWKTLKDRFLKEHKERGYPKDYDVSVLADDGADTTQPASTDETEEAPTNQSSF